MKPHRELLVRDSEAIAMNAPKGNKDNYAYAWNDNRESSLFWADMHQHTLLILVAYSVYAG